MKSHPQSAVGILSQLCAHLTVSTSRWTSTTTEHLHAVAAPRRRSDGRWDAVVHLRPVAVDAIPGGMSRDLQRCIVHVADRPELRSSVKPGGRLDLGPLDAGEFKLAVLDVGLQLARELDAATSSWRETPFTRSDEPPRSRSEVERTYLPLACAADERSVVEVWRWRTPGGLLLGHAVADELTHALTFSFESPEIALDSTLVHISIDAHARIPLVLRQTTPGRGPVLGAATVHRSVYRRRAGAIRFDVPR